MCSKKLGTHTPPSLPSWAPSRLQPDIGFGDGDRACRQEEGIILTLAQTVEGSFPQAEECLRVA